MKTKFLSLEWFKSKIEQTTEIVIAKKLNGLLDEMIEQEAFEEVTNIKVKDPEVVKSLYKQLKLIGDNLTIVFHDDSIINKSNATKEDWLKVKNAKTEKEILSIVSTPEIVEEKIKEEKIIKKNKILKKGISLLEKTEEFITEKNSVYIKGISRSLPQLLVEKFIEVVNRIQEENSEKSLQEAINKDDEYLALKRFFMWCCLNPRAEVANSLYNFLTDNQFRITKQGFFVALRNVVTLKSEADNETVNFISNAYNKVKAIWKKNPSNFYLTKDKIGNTILTSVKPTEGDDRNLTELYLDLPNMSENRYTDNWTKTFDIRIGQVVSMPSEQCNWSTQDCAAAGLHFAGYTAPYVLCGDTTVFTLINPMKVVGIGLEKGRCYEYLPFMITTVAEADKIMNDGTFDFLQLDDEYAINELENLEHKAQEGFVIETTKHQFNLPSISLSEIHSIANSLNQMKKEIKERVKEV